MSRRLIKNKIPFYERRTLGNTSLAGKRINLYTNRKRNLAMFAIESVYGEILYKTDIMAMVDAISLIESNETDSNISVHHDSGLAERMLDYCEQEEWTKEQYRRGY